MTPALVRAGWKTVAPELFACRDGVEADLEELLARYVQNVDEPGEAALAYAG